MRVKIGVPARDTVMTGFFHSCAMLVAQSAAAGIEVSLTTSAGTLICDQRNNLAKSVVEEGHDFLLMLDSDMRFPSNALTRMLDRNEAIVTANYSTRRAPAEPVAFKSIGTLEKLYTDEDSTGLEECAANGLGVALIHRTVFEQTPKPWFYIPYLPEQDGHWGEDVWFCNQVRKAGFPVFVDHDLSKEVRHIGMREYDYLDCAVMKDEVRAQWAAGLERKDRLEPSDLR
jgi:hypothetical protein